MAQSTVLEPDFNQMDPPPPATRYANIREADVMWSKRVWRRIDLRSSENQILKSDKRGNEISVNSFFNVLTNEISSGNAVAYSTGTEVKKDDSFKTVLTINQVKGFLLETNVYKNYNENGEAISADTVSSTISAKRIKYFDIKEEWVFDKSRSIMDVRIIGILPIIEVYDDETGGTILKELFWIYYPVARQIFAKYWAVYKSDEERLSYE